MQSSIKNISSSEDRITYDFPYKSHFLNINGFEIHYIDEGNKEANPIILLHGIPTWSYVFRFVIPFLLEKGHRIIAPDIIGFGKSSKPKSKENYTFDKLTNHLELLLKELNLTRIVLFGHDWGAILGMRLAVSNEARFKGLIISNGFIPKENLPIPLLFKIWKIFTKYSPYLPIGRLIRYASIKNLSRRERQNYDYPYKSSSQKIAIRLLPQLLPFKPETQDYHTAKEIWLKLENWEKPFLTVFSSRDSISKGGDKILQKHIPGSKGQKHQLLKAGHFITEDMPVEVANIIHQFIQTV